MAKGKQTPEVVSAVTMQSLNGGPVPKQPDPVERADKTKEKKIRTVGLDSLPDIEIESESDFDAIQQYNAIMGVNSTMNQHRIK